MDLLMSFINTSHLHIVIQYGHWLLYYISWRILICSIYHGCSVHGGPKMNNFYLMSMDASHSV